jgi:hypothetical protein
MFAYRTFSFLYIPERGKSMVHVGGEGLWGKREEEESVVKGKFEVHVGGEGLWRKREEEESIVKGKFEVYMAGGGL